MIKLISSCRVKFKRVLNFSLKMNFSTQKSELEEIFLASVRAVDPVHLVNNVLKVTYDDNQRYLVVNSEKFPIYKPIHIAAFGKAVERMSLAAESILGPSLVEQGVVTIPVGSRKTSGLTASSQSKLSFIEGAAHNLPDEDARHGAELILDMVRPLGDRDLLLVIISGGGSALLPLPLPGIQLADKQVLIKDLANSGADILELNTVRTALSEIKGGGLALAACPCPIVAIILSDVIGDLLDIIASGPTIIPDDYQLVASKARTILEKYNLQAKQPDVIKKYILNPSSHITELDPDEIGKYRREQRVQNFVIGNNRMATMAAEEAAIERGFDGVVVLSNTIDGDVVDVAKLYVQLALIVKRVLMENNHGKSESAWQTLSQFVQLHFNCDLQSTLPLPLESERSRMRRLCFIMGGETTVVVNSASGGLGGRNQQLALEFAVQLNRHRRLQDVAEGDDDSVHISFLSAGTDGRDGPTDAAGARVDGSLMENVAADGHVLALAETALVRNDCYNFWRQFRRGECLVRTGHTGTNVMDVHLLAVCLPSGS